MTRKNKAWLIIGGLVVLAMALFLFSLPRLVHDALISQAAKLGLKDLRLRVVHVGLGRLELADISSGPRPSPWLRIQRAAVTYTPLGLLRRKINGVRLANFVIRLEKRSGRLAFPGLGVPPGNARGNADPFELRSIEAEKGKLQLPFRDGTWDIPFSAQARGGRSGHDVKASLSVLGNRIRLRGGLDRNFASGRVTFAAEELSLPSLHDLGWMPADASLAGRIELRGEVSLRQGHFAGARVDIQGKDGIEMAIPGQGGLALTAMKADFRLGPEFIPQDIAVAARVARFAWMGMEATEPFDLDMRGNRWPDLDLELRRVRLVRPVPLRLEKASAHASLPWPAISVRGDFRIMAEEGAMDALGMPLRIARPYGLSVDFHARREGGRVDWTLKARGDGTAILAAGKDRLSGRLILDALVSGDGRSARAAASGRLQGADWQWADARGRAAALDMRADLRHVFAGEWQARGVLQVRGGRFSAPGEVGVLAEGIEWESPWSLSGRAPEWRGSFSIARIEAGGAGGRDIHGVVAPRGRGLSFSGQGGSSLPGLAFSFAGKATPRAGSWGVEAELRVPPATIPAGTQLEALHPALKGLAAGGRLEAHARIRADGRRLKGSAGLDIAGAGFGFAAAGLSLSGLHGAVQLDDWLEFVTPPDQRLRFTELRWQGLILRDGEVAFRGLGAGALQIESGRFGWSGGTVLIDPLRLEPGAAEPVVTLRCRDVDLAAMLNALAGEEIVSGDARLSGVVPLKLAGGRPVFLDGRLESDPTHSGRLRVSRPEAISGGQALVEEAIRDFRWNWIKVRLDGRDDRLNLVFSIDGAPAAKLPLRYDRKKKDFVRDPKGRPSVELKGLLLDIRFNDVDVKDLLEASSRMAAGRNGQ
ncbi:MAG TPA: YdbH domain-containing protein [Candidatus Aminicenantes bacterium]|nr:YdbH domain-containing protein [Candidatus Aminicenantes bacterium]